MTCQLHWLRSGWKVQRQHRTDSHVQCNSGPGDRSHSKQSRAQLSLLDEKATRTNHIGIGRLKCRLLPPVSLVRNEARQTKHAGANRAVATILASTSSMAQLALDWCHSSGAFAEPQALTS